MSLGSVFQKLFSSYRDGNIITARWQHTASGSVWTRITTNAQTSYRGIVVADRGAGLLTVTFPACKNAVFLGNPYLEALGDTVTDCFNVSVKTMSPTTGTIQLVITNKADPNAVVDPPDGAILCLTMLVSK